MKLPRASRRIVMRLALACLILGAAPAWAARVPVTLAVNPDGSFDTAKRCLATDRSDCKGPTLPTLQLSNISIPDQTTGTAYSQDLKALACTGTGCAAATVTLVNPLDGTPCSPPSGWAFASPPVLTYSGSGTGTNTCQAKFVSSTAVLSNTFTLRATAPPSSDVTPPTELSGCSVTAQVGAGLVACPATSDIFDGTVGSGVDHYVICQNAINCVNVQAAQPSVQPQLSFFNVGTLSPTPTAVQSGNQVTLVAAGDSDGVDDKLGFFGAQITGDVEIVAKTTSITTSNDYAKSMVMLYADPTNAGSVKFECGPVRQANGSYYEASSQRASTGGSRQTVGVVNPAIGFPTWTRVRSTGTTVSCEQSLDNKTFTSIGSPVVIAGLPTTKYAGIGATATTGSGGATQTTVIQQLNITQGSPWNYTYVTAVSGPVTIQPCDVAGNCATATSISLTPLTASDGTNPVPGTASGTAAGSSTQVNWNCGTGTDNVAVRGYVPEFCGTSSSCASPSVQPEQVGSAITQAGLTASTTYYARCKVADTSGNLSAYTNIASAATAASSGSCCTAPGSVAAIQATDRSANYTITYTAGTGAHHYILQSAQCADGQSAGSSPVWADEPGFTNVTGLSMTLPAAITTVKAFRVVSSDATRQTTATSTATSCTTIYEPWSQALQITQGDYVQLYGLEDRATVERSLALGYFNLGPEWVGLMRTQLQLGAFEGPLTGNATSHSQANPVTGAGYERGAELMNWYSAQATAKGKTFIMMLSDRFTGGYPVPLYPKIYPLWASEEAAYDNPADPAGNGCYFKTETGSQGSSGWVYYWRTWDTGCADAMADAFEWMCRHYDSDPAWEGPQLASVSTPVFETSNSFPHSGYTWAGHVAGIKTILARARQYCVHKEVSIRFDWPKTYADGLAFWRWARGYRITKSDYDFTDFAGRTGSVSASSVATGENSGFASFRGAASQLSGTSGVAGVNLIGKASVIGPTESFDWVRANTYGVVSIDEFFDIAKYYKSSRHFWTPDEFSCGRDSGFTPTNLGKTSSTGTNCPGSGTTIWTVIKQCMATTTDLPAIGCTVAVRDARWTGLACPTDWIGCTP